MAMPSDDERREAARRLRYVAEHGAPEWETSACCIAECIGEDDYPLWGGSEPVFAKLADLIEPPLQCPHYDSGKHWCGVHDAPAIDRAALLELADSMDEEADAADDAARCALLPGGGPMGERAARRHRGATADRERRDACGWRAAARIVRLACGEEGR